MKTLMAGALLTLTAMAFMLAPNPAAGHENAPPALVAFAAERDTAAPNISVVENVSFVAPDFEVSPLPSFASKSVRQEADAGVIAPDSVASFPGDSGGGEWSSNPGLRHIADVHYRFPDIVRIRNL